MWRMLDRLSFCWRTLIKWLVFLAIVLATLFPHIGLFVQQLGNYRNPDRLIDPRMPGMDEINRQINRTLPPSYSQRDEFKAVERFVYQHVQYRYDWDTWGNIDYWPAVAEVWRRKAEDCDGRAVLAASILRARGYPSARIVANLNHVWVQVDSNQLMGAEPEVNFRRIGGKLQVSLPSWATLLDTLAFLHEFPCSRSLAIILAALVLLYHPCRNLVGFFLSATVGLSGFLLVLDWGRLRMNRVVPGANATFVAGLVLIGLSLLLASAMPLFLRWIALARKFPVRRASNPLPPAAPAPSVLEGA